MNNKPIKARRARARTVAANPRRHRLMVLVCATSLVSVGAEAHDLRPEEKNQLAAAASVTYRTDEAVARGEPALIPGVMLGGEALPVHQGASLDHAQLSGKWLAPGGYRVRGNLSAHEYAGEVSLELETLSFDQRYRNALGVTEIALGRMGTEMTPLAAWHASDNASSEAPLLADVFWGRHFADTGFRVKQEAGALSYGVEVWNGDAWPSANGATAADLFGRYRATFAMLEFEAGAYYYYTDMANRSDTRYRAGHSHGGTTVTNPAGDYRFTGTLDSAGGFIELATQNRLGHFRARFEVLGQRTDGEVLSAGQSSVYQGDHYGWIAQADFYRGRHQWHLRVERLVAENRFLSDVSDLFISDAGLANNGFEPMEASTGWLFECAEGLDIRTELVASERHHEQTDYRFNIGIRWQQQWRL